MTFFCGGIHEVVCKRADGKLYIGYFDEEQKALASVEGDSPYQALRYSLNSLKELPQGARLNGPLVRSNRRKKDWMAERKRLLIDIDPLRDYENSSDEEKAAACQQAQAVKQYLCELGWPEPMLCDSGNGYHLIFEINLPNDQQSEDLVRGVLLALAAKFDNSKTHIDTSVFEASPGQTRPRRKSETSCQLFSLTRCGMNG
jgi:hypothetical protein